MSNAELFQALNMFKQGVQEAATTAAVNDATQAMKQIQTGITDQAQQRQALDGLSRELALRLTGVGAPASTIQSAFSAIAPQSFGSAEQMQLEGMASGNQHLIKTADTIIGDRRAAAKEMKAIEFGFQDALNNNQFKRELALQSMKLSKEATLKGMERKPEEIAFQTNINIANKLIDDLEATVQQYGTAEMGFGTKEAKRASAKLEAIPYQLAITYAKIVDPNSVAREGEVEAAKKYLLNLGALSSPEKSLEALQHMRQTIQEYAGARGSRTGVSASPQATDIQVKRLADGSLVKVRRLPDGRFEEVP